MNKALLVGVPYSGLFLAGISWTLFAQLLKSGFEEGS